ncbi:MAG TPA: hypothetical protein VGQ91_11665 [Ideonella sp.]|jgi:hypothetical protein|nr:hypothetical protein [Ideonella sp.]
MNITNPPRPADRGRLVLAAFVAWGIVSTALLQGLNVDGSNILRLEIAPHAAAFVEELHHWQESKEAVCGIGAAASVGGPGYGTLRCQLFVDSIGLVPAYVGLLLFFTLAFSRGAGIASPLARHLMCAPAVAAGLFDIAENGMTGRAVEDYVHIVLADATVHDVTHASLTKWALLAIAFALVAGLALATARRGQTHGARWLLAGAALGFVGALLFAAGVVTQAPGLFGPGMGLAIVSLMVLAAWRWRNSATPKGSN